MVSTTDKYEAKSWLYRGWNLSQEIKSLLKLRGESFDALTSAVAKLNGMPGGSTNPHKFDRHAELCDMIDRRVEELSQIQAEILQAVSAVKDSRYRTLLIDRYIRFMLWEQVAAEMNYGFRHVLKLHAEALEAFAETWH